MACLRLRQPSLGTSHFLIHLGCRTADLFIRVLKQFGERKLYMGTYAFNFGEAIVACLFEERRECVLVQPVRLLRIGCDYRHLCRRIGSGEVPEYGGILQPGLTLFGDLYGEETLMNYLSKSVYNPRSVEIYTYWIFMLKRVERCALVLQLPFHGECSPLCFP